jgi:hypothetical protein
LNSVVIALIFSSRHINIVWNFNISHGVFGTKGAYLCGRQRDDVPAGPLSTGLPWRLKRDRLAREHHGGQRLMD